MKIKSSTLVEVITAMTIIGISFGISLIAFLSVTQSNNLHKKIAIHQQIRTIANDVKANKKLINDRWEKDEVSIVKTVEKAGSNGLLKLNIKAYRDSSLTEEYNDYIISE